MSANYGEYEFNFSTKDGEKDEASAKTAFDWCVKEYDWFEEDGFYLSGNSIKMDGNYCSALGDEGNEDEMKEWITGMAEASGAEVIFGYYISDHTESADEFYWKEKFSYVDGKCSVKEVCTERNEDIIKEASPAETVVIPEGTTKIAESKYENYMSLLFVSIPSSVTEIGESAFDRCDLLVSVKFGGTVSQWEAVKGKLNLCKYLNAKSVKCADGEWQKPVLLVENGVAVKYLDRNATSVTIPDGVTKIGWCAFSGCSSLSSVAFGGTVAQWEAVEEKQNLLADIPASSVKCADGEWQKPVVHVENGVAVKCLDENATSVTIPDGVTKIGWCAFEGCKSLASVEIPSSVTKIGDFAFFGCNSLSSVVIPSSVTEIGEHAFENCKSLASVEIPSSVTEIGEHAFRDCESLASVVIPASVTEIGKHAFENCKSLASVEIPSSVTEIGYSAFDGCKSLSSVKFGGTIAQWEAVEGKPELLRYIPASSVKCADGEWQKPVLLVENGVAVDCLDLNATSVTIPEGVTEIGEHAFSDCESLTSVEIPSSVTKIGDWAFVRCDLLVSVKFGGTVAQWEAVEGKPELLRYIPASSVKCADGEWQKPVLLVENGVAVKCLDLNATSVTIPEGVTEIGWSAFSGCSLSSVVIPSSVKKIGGDAFCDCESLSSVEFGGTVAQWKAVEKEADWHYGVPASSVKCLDGKCFEENNECFEEDDEYFDDDDED